MVETTESDKEQSGTHKQAKQEPVNAAKKIAVNKNPAANENVSADKSQETTTGAGSEITDGEGG
jgi:hypothetical protein